MDKGVANRFIKHAIAQVKAVRPPGQDEGVSSPSEETVRVPVKVTSKMLARAEYEREIKELGSEEEEDLEIIDDVDESSSPQAGSANKGKGKVAGDENPADVSGTLTGRKRRRPAVDAFAGKELTLTVGFELVLTHPSLPSRLW